MPLICLLIISSGNGHFGTIFINISTCFIFIANDHHCIAAALYRLGCYGFGGFSTEIVSLNVEACLCATSVSVVTE